MTASSATLAGKSRSHVRKEEYRPEMAHTTFWKGWAESALPTLETFQVVETYHCVFANHHGLLSPRTLPVS